MTATRHSCVVSDEHPHTSGSGRPRRVKCKHCGGGIVRQAGWWGVFLWSNTGRYPMSDAIATHAYQYAAQKVADTRPELVVRWIPVGD